MLEIIRFGLVQIEIVYLYIFVFFMLYVFIFNYYGEPKRRSITDKLYWRFTHGHVRARLEKLTTSTPVRLTDKLYMQELQERVAVGNQESLNKRISERVVDEMERLKHLILCGKTPLSECPPELFNHPVFVFWRLVDREVARACKKRADAYYKKLETARRVDAPPEEVAEEEEEGLHLASEELLQRCRAELAAQQLADCETGSRMHNEEFAKLKYETEDVKRLKALTTVEELYKLADQIIGAPRHL